MNAHRPTPYLCYPCRAPLIQQPYYNSVYVCPQCGRVVTMPSVSPGLSLQFGQAPPANGAAPYPGSLQESSSTLYTETQTNGWVGREHNDPSSRAPNDIYPATPPLPHDIPNSYCNFDGAAGPQATSRTAATRLRNELTGNTRYPELPVQDGLRYAHTDHVPGTYPVTRTPVDSNPVRGPFVLNPEYEIDR